jgi:hypothetical protein
MSCHSVRLLACGGLLGVLSVALLKAQPQAPATTPAVWTPASSAPAGLLTPLERERHDRFIDRAKAGGIDIVFFGSTETEMWLWQDRGRSQWERAFGPLRAADFGSQGTRFASLLWRMQNGELNGYQAKLVVLQAQGVGFAGDAATRGNGFEDYVSKYAAIIAEIRARQPEAKILFFGVFPRYQTHAAPTRENAVLSKLGNNESVFFIDIRDRFFRPDGSFDTRLWNYEGLNVGMQSRAFEVWAEALQPWLECFVR